MNRYTLADGVELCGEYRGSGYVERRHLVRRGDGTMVELSALLYAVAASLDGERDEAGVAVAVNAGAPARPLTAEGVAYLVESKLCPLGVVATSSGVGRTASAAPVLGLAVRGRVIPKPVVRRIAGALKPLFLPPVVAVVLLCLGAVDGWLLAGDRVATGVSRIVAEPALLPLVVGLTILGGLFHELGHATASRYGGAEPGVIGAGIYVLWPVFYNDLNDSYRLNRTGRLRADLGGVYFNVVFILVLTALYGLTGLEVLLAAITVQHMAIVQQFLPFVRLDGYYVVSDAAGVPNLFEHVRPVLATLIPGRGGHPAGLLLRRRARLIVTTWVLLAVPLLAACIVFLVVRLPDLVEVGVQMARAHALLFSAAVRNGSVLGAVGSALQLLFLAAVFAGLSFTIARLVRGVVRRKRV